MWFEILPCYLIMVGSMWLPGISAGVGNFIVQGNFFRRCLGSEELQMQYLRDARLTGSPYKVAGLENIPDEEEGGGKEN